MKTQKSMNVSKSAINSRLVLKTVHQTTKLWAENHFESVNHLANTPKLYIITEDLLALPRNRQALLESSELALVRSSLAIEIARNGQEGFFIIAPDGVSIASLRDTNIGTTNLIAMQRRDLFDRVFRGETVLVPPIVSDVSLSNKKGNTKATQKTMFFLAPIKNNSDKVIAALSLRLDPKKYFSQFTNTIRFGDSGETFIIDKNGLMLSNSRFEDQLQEIGLLEQGENSALNVYIRDPGGNLLEGHPKPVSFDAQPFTLMATNAIFGNDGSNVAGYRDYRGVTVMGAWLWDHKLGIGMATEIDVDDAMRTFRDVRFTIFIVLILTIFTSLLLMGLFVSVSNSANRSLKRAHDNLENQVERRTLELRKSEQRIHSIIDNAADGIIVMSDRGIVQSFSPAAERIFGFSESEVVGQNIKMLMPEPMRSEHNGYLKRYLDGAKPRIINKNREVVGQRKNSETFHMDLAVSELHLDGERLFTGIVRDISERKEMEERLLFTQYAVDHAADCAFWVNPEDASFDYVNDTACEVLGYTHEEFQSMSVQDIDTGLPLDQWDTLMVGSLKSNPYVTAESTQRCKDGREFPVEGAFYLAEFNGKQLIVAFTRDISSRKETEEALRVQEERLDMALKGANACLWDWSVATGELITGDIWSTMLGYTSEELDKKYGQRVERWKELVHPDDLPGACEEVEKHINGETEIYKAQFRMRTADDQWKWIQDIGQASVRDDDGRATRMVGVHLDISEQKAKEAHLRFTEYVMERAADQICWADNETGQYVYVNESSINQLGYTREELLQMTPMDLAPGYTLEQFHQTTEKIKQSETSSIQMELRQRRKDGVMRDYSISIGLGEHEGRVMQIAIKRDVTDELKAKQALEIARDAAEEATKAKGDFLANMSHEIRTPMNAIIGLSHLVLGTELTNKQRDYITKVYNSGRNLLDIINDILDFSKIEAGKLDIDQIDFDLNRILDHLSNVVSFQANEKNLELLIVVPSDVPTALCGDPLRLGQILINLCNNAVKFTDSGEIDISIKLIDESDGRVNLRFEVKDTGIGLNKKQQNKLFKPFSQADGSTTRKHGGTGLGLSISKRLVEMMGGEIGVKSKFGKGSTFYFNVVLKHAESKIQQKTLIIPNDLQGMQVLVVDDNSTSRKILVNHLNLLGFISGETASGEEAIQQLKNSQNNVPYKLVLMDWQMPGINGIEASRHILQDEGLSNKPAIIMVSAYSPKYLLSQAQAVGVNGYLVKPVSQSSLFDAIMLAFNKVSVTSSRVEEIPEASMALRGARLLLVEDNEINQQVAQELLKMAGISVTIANNGKEAVEAVEKGSFDGILMDLQMPVMDGFEATEIIRNDGRFNELPIIAMTANAMAGDREHCLEAGMNDHVPKPIEIKKLYDALVKWVTASNPQVEIVGEIENPDKTSVDILIPEMDGIDIEDGLRRLSGNKKLYHNILMKFHESHADDMKKLDSALANDDMELAQHIAHTVRGVAGNVGAKALFKAAEACENLIKKGKRIDGEKTLMQLELDRVLNSVKQLTEETVSTDKVDAEVDLEALKPLLRELEGYLREDDTQASEVLYTIREKNPGIQATINLSAIESAVSKYDFEKALDIFIAETDGANIGLKGEF